MRNSKKINTLEDYEILLQELIAYRELDSQEFNFHGEVIRNTGEYGLGSEDAYYKMDIQSLKEAILYFGIDDECKPRKRKDKLCRYYRKMYHKKHKHIGKIKNFTPGYSYSYGYDINTGEYRYWERYYVQDKKLRKIGNSIIRSIKPGKEEFPLKCGGYRKVHDYWWDLD